MLYYDKIDVSEGIGINKTSESKKPYICQYCYLLNKGFKFRSCVCSRCHDLDIAILLFLILKVLIIAKLLVELAKVKP